MFNQIKSVLQSATKTGPYAPLTPEEEALRSYAARLTKLRSKVVDEYRVNLQNDATFKGWPITVAGVGELASADNSLVRRILSDQKITNMYRHEQIIFSRIRDTLLVKKIIANTSNDFMSVKEFIYETKWGLYSGKKNDLHPLFGLAVSADDDERKEYYKRVEFLCDFVCNPIDNRSDTDIKADILRVLRKHATSHPELDTALLRAPELIRRNEIMNFYFGHAYTDEEIAFRRKLQADAYQAKIQEELERKRIADEKAARDREEQIRKAAAFLEARHVDVGDDGALDISSNSQINHTQIPSSEFPRLRNSVAARINELFMGNPTLRISHDRIKLSRRLDTLAPEARAAVAWFLCCTHSDIAPPTKLTWNQQDHVNWLMISCLLSEQYIVKDRTGLGMTDMYRDIENAAYSAVMIQAKGRSVGQVYQEARAYATKFTDQPGEFGALARMVCGEEAASGWASSR